MARFAFRLNSLLHVRQAERDQRQSLLAAALAEERQLQARRAVLEGDLRAQLGRARAVIGPGALDVAGLESAHRYASNLRAQLAALAEGEQALSQEINHRRQAVVEADREVRVLEKLRERQQQQHRTEQARAESKQLDEIAARTTGCRPIE